MKNKTSLNQEGSVVQILLAVVVVVVVAVVGVFAWKNMKKNADDVSSDLGSKLASAKCDYDDKDLCKFFTSYKEHKSYKLVMTTTTAEGQQSTSTIEAEGHDKTHMTMSGSGMNIETITIGKTIYTKAANGTWWKQTLDDKKLEETKKDVGTPELKEPSKDEPEAQKTQYKKIGKEPCGKLECFKYQVIQSSDSSTTEYIWFDTKDYQMRRSTSESSEGKSEMVYTYEDVKISEPSPVKELGPNQYLMPGQSEPTTMPDMSQYQM